MPVEEGLPKVEEGRSKEGMLRRDRLSPPYTSPIDPERSEWSGATLVIAGLTVLALVLRFWKLGEWNFQATEIFTLRDSHSPQFGNPRPLMYLLNYYIVRPFTSLDEFALRLFPAIFGVLAIPALYFVGRRLVGTRAALFATLFLVFSPLHISYSQLARYWSLVFLLSAIYPYAIYVGVRERDRWMLAFGIVSGILAVLAHPVAILLTGGMGFFVIARFRREQLSRLWNHKTARWAAVILAIVIAVIAVRFVPMLHAWIDQHDKHPGVGQFLLRPKTLGIRQVVILVQYLESFSAPLVLSSAMGVYLLWQLRQRTLAFYLVCVATFPIIFLVLLSLRTAISAYYLLPSAPAFFIAAGVFLDRLCDLDGKLRPRWLLPAVVTMMILAAIAPTLISDYRDGRRYDFRAAATWLKTRLMPRDVVFSDQPIVMAHYLPETDVEHLRQNVAPLRQSVQTLQKTGGVLWIVAPAPSHPFRTNLRYGGLITWIHDHCQLQKTLGAGRVDFRQQYLQVYRCPATTPATATAADARLPDQL